MRVIPMTLLISLFPPRIPPQKPGFSDDKTHRNPYKATSGPFPMANIDELKAADGTLDAEAIMKIIPYGSNFLMVDKVTLLEKRRVQATKKSDLKQFEGHFRDFPLMPGALIIEGLGQAATLLLRYNLPNHETKEILAYKIKEAKFSLPTFPGDELLFDVQMAGMEIG